MQNDIDLTQCDREPIHLIGQIQPSGYLLAFDAESRAITHCSANIAKLLGREASELLDKPASDALGMPAVRQILSELSDQESGQRIHRAITLAAPGEGRLAHTWIHRSVKSERIVVEVSARDFGQQDARRLIESKVLERLEYASDLTSLTDQATQTLKRLTGFDRVMLYKFHDDSSGEVIAESRREDLDAYLGLHYPASDIPRQARRLFRLSRVRVIGDTHYEPVKILAATQADEIDLTYSMLRAVAPVHVEYLKNMGVAASLSISLVNQGRLWGLVACHHYSPLELTPDQLTSAELVSQMLSVLIARQERIDISDRLRAYQSDLQLLLREVIADPVGVHAAVLKRLDAVRDLVDAGGCAFVDGMRNGTSGDCPTAEQIGSIAAHYQAAPAGSVQATKSLSEEMPQAREFKDVASGLMLLKLSDESCIMWFLPECTREMRWAGNPEKAVQAGTGPQRLRPRESFELWKQTVANQSRPWTAAEREVASKLRQLASARAVNESARIHHRLESAVDPILIVDLDGRVLDWNRSTETRLGLTKIAGTDLSSLVAFTRAESFDDIMARARGGEVWSGEYERTIDGEAAIFEVALLPNRDGDGNISHVACILRDVSERKRLELQLRQAQKMEAIGQLTGGIAHNFNNMLTIMMGYADIAINQLPPDHPARPDLQTLKDTGMRATAMVRELMTYSRSRPAEARVNDIGELVDQLRTVVQPLIRSDISLTVSQPDDSLFARIDAQEFEQVLMNLIVNAQDAIRASGQLKISTRRRNLGDVVNTPSGPVGPGDYVALTVADSGSGMDESTMARIFDPFYTTKGETEGTGLGLSTCMGIIRNLGGAITVASQPGSGSEFTILLPLMPPTEKPQPESKSGQQDSTSRLSGQVILVEDEPSLRDIVARVLTMQGLEVLEANNGEEALRLLNDGIENGQDIRLVMTDQVMPNMRGTELAAHVARNHPNVALLLVSGYDMQMDLPSRDNHGFMQKPFNMKQLIERVTEILGDA